MLPAPQATFQQKVKQVDRACCAGKGQDVCRGGTPVLCDLECALEYLPFFEECQNLINVLGKQPAPTTVVVGPSGTPSKTISVGALHHQPHIK